MGKKKPLIPLAKNGEARLKKVVSRQPSAEEMMFSEEDIQRVCRAISKLDPRKQTILMMRYGMGQYSQRYTLEKVGHYLQLTRQRVRELEGQAIEELKALLNHA